MRRSVRKAQWRAYQRQAAVATLMSPHAAWLVERVPQVRYSVRILFQELCATRGFTGGYDTVKMPCGRFGPRRRSSRSPSAASKLPLASNPRSTGARCGSCSIAGPTKICVFVLTLGYSRRSFAQGFEHERIGSLLAAHEAAFEHFGGHTAELLYDRMRTVVLGTEEGRPRWNPTFDAFARHWGFEPRLCRQYRAKTKGKVESGVKYVKRNFLPGRRFRDLADFNEQLAAWLAEVADVRVHGTTHQRPIVSRKKPARSCVPPASRAFSRRWCASGWWPKIGSCQSTPTAIPCPAL